MQPKIAPQRLQWNHTRTFKSGCLMDVPSGRVLIQMLVHVDEALYQSPEGPGPHHPPALKLCNAA